jgi:hypothetical protein
MTGRAGWHCTALSTAGNIDLEQIDDAGEEWIAIGPGGEAIGSLHDALTSSAADGTDPDWVDAVAAALQREITIGGRRTMLLVKRGAGAWYHTTFAANRQSIQRHGLDWRLFHGQGIAGSRSPEWPGIFLCATIELDFGLLAEHRGPCLLDLLHFLSVGAGDSTFVILGR